MAASEGVSLYTPARMRPFFKRYDRRVIEQDPAYPAAQAAWTHPVGPELHAYAQGLMAHEVMGEPGADLSHLGDVSCSVDGDVLDVVFAPRGSTPDDVALEFLKIGRIQDAADLLEHILRTDGVTASRLYSLGLSYTQLSRLSEAEVALERAVSMEPGHSNAWLSLGGARYRLSRHAAAEEALRTALSANPDNLAAHRTLGSLLCDMGRHGDALAPLGRYLDARPQSLREAALYAMASSELGDSASNADVARGLELAIQVMREAPDSNLSAVARSARARLVDLAKRRQAVSSGILRMDVVEDLRQACVVIDGLSEDRLDDLVLELAKIAAKGVAVHDLTASYRVNALSTDYSAKELMALLFAGIKRVNPDLDSGIDYAAEYAYLLGQENSSN